MAHSLIIGAGIGGLTTAALLLRARHRVTVLEAHVYPRTGHPQHPPRRATQFAGHAGHTCVLDATAVGHGGWLSP